MPGIKPTTSWLPAGLLTSRSRSVTLHSHGMRANANLRRDYIQSKCKDAKMRDDTTFPSFTYLCEKRLQSSRKKHSCEAVSRKRFRIEILMTGLTPRRPVVESKDGGHAHRYHAWPPGAVGPRCVLDDDGQKWPKDILFRRQAPSPPLFSGKEGGG